MFLNSKTHSYGKRTCVDSNQTVELHFYPLESVSQLTWAVLIQMDLIVGSENGKASSTDILNSADTLTTKKLKKSETEHLLNRLVHDKWLNEVKHRISITFINQLELCFSVRVDRKLYFLEMLEDLDSLSYQLGPFSSMLRYAKLTDHRLASYLLYSYESCINLSCKVRKRITVFRNIP